MVLIIFVDGLGCVDVLTHYGNELNTHALVLEVPSIELVPPQVIVLKMFQETVVLLGTNLPLVPAAAEGVVLGMLDGCVVKDVMHPVA